MCTVLFKREAPPNDDVKVLEHDAHGFSLNKVKISI